jgi:hypothetical protein
MRWVRCWGKEGNELLEGDGGVKVGLGFADAWLPKSR